MPASEINYPGPYEVRMFYTVNTIQHVQRLNVRVDGTPAPGTAMADIDFLRRDNLTYTATDEIEDWADLIKPLLSSASSTIDFAELWKYEPGTFNAEFISTHPLAVAGTNASAYNPAGQIIFTFRTLEGGLMKISVMETTFLKGLPLAYPAMSAAAQAVADAVQLGTSPWLARDTSYPFSFIKLFPGENEATFKKRYRP